MRKISLFITTLILLTTACKAKQSTSTVKTSLETKATATEAIQNVENDPTNTQIYTLKNGLKVYLSVNKEAPRVQTYIAVKAGSKFDPAETTGLAHYLEHMMFKGTHKIGTKDWKAEKKLLDKIAEKFEAHKNESNETKKRAIYKEIDKLSYEASKLTIANEYDKMISSLGAKGTNAYTSFDRTVYTNDIPANEMEKFLKIEGERFQTLVLRLFHTELETVYEEFNRSQDNDGRWVYQGVLEGLFPNHPYGFQTTIGKGEHLKNPSLYNIMDYYNNYYRPNNVAICLSGDIDITKTIALVEKYFGNWEANKTPEFNMPIDKELTAPIIKETFGPQQESVYVGFKFDGAGSEEAKMLSIVDMILANSQAGLIDLNLKLGQKVLNAGSFPQILKDHSAHFLYGLPKEGQKLEQVKDLLLAEIENVKQGNFDDWLIEACVNNLKLNRIQTIEKNRGRANLMVDAFINDIAWKDYIFEYEAMDNITKEDVMAFAQKHYKENYVVSFKRKGEANRHAVPKPEITQLELDREASSVFFEEVKAIKSTELEPEFLNFEESITRSNVNSYPFFYVENKNNELFSLSYIFDIGSDHSKDMALAVSYLPFLGTDKYSAAELQKEFYRLALDFNVNTGRDKMYITLSGLEKNVGEGISLLEHILKNVEANKDAYKELVASIIKKRNDAKLDKGTILRSALVNFAKHGDENPFTDNISAEELKEKDINKLVEILKNLTKYPHKIYYYGQNNTDKILPILEKAHPKQDLIKIPTKKVYKEKAFKKNKVYYAPYDMQQVELYFLAPDEAFSPELMAASMLFNEYFGAGLSSIVFQEIREKKALAYSAYSYYANARKKGDNNYVFGYIGTQHDKLAEALEAMMNLMNDMPESEIQFNGAKEAALKKIASSRTTGSSIFWVYESALKRGLTEDVNQQVYENLQNFSLKNLSQFFQEHIKNKKFSFCIIGNPEKIDKRALKSMGEINKMDLETLFGY
ncbi:MAG: M16 family metallopeptidase [Chitinophagales bacterium]